MKFIGFVCLLLITASGVRAQLLSGDILTENRKLISKTDFTVTGNYEGYIVYELSVNRKGIVTSERLITEESTIRSTPANIAGKKLLHALKFESGIHFPAEHHVTVRVNYRKSPNPPPATPAGK